MHLFIPSLCDITVLSRRLGTGYEWLTWFEGILSKISIVRRSTMNMQGKWNVDWNYVTLDSLLVCTNEFRSSWDRNTMDWSAPNYRTVRTPQDTIVFTQIPSPPVQRIDGNLSYSPHRLLCLFSSFFSLVARIYILSCLSHCEPVWLID